MAKRNSYTDVLDLSNDLIIYTNNRTKPIVNELNAGKVRKALNDIAHIEDPEQMKDACYQAAKSIPSTDKKMGFSKSAYRDFGQDMRHLAVEINKKIRRANYVNFKEHPEDRFAIMDDIILDISDFKQDIHLCLESKFITPTVAFEWTGKVRALEDAVRLWRDSCKALKARNDAEKNQSANNISQFNYSNNYQTQRKYDTTTYPFNNNGNRRF